MIKLALASLLVGLAATSAAAQSRDSVTVDFTLGSSNGSGGNQLYAQTDGVGAALTIAFRNRGRTPIAPVHAFALEGRASGIGDVCLIDPSAPHGCAPYYPSFISAGFLGGAELGDSRAALRALVGPAYFATNGRDGLGAQLDLDASAGTKHVALVASLRHDLIRRFSGETLRVSSVGFGLRFK